MKKTILILLCGWFAIMATRAQCAAQNEAIQAGEELVYDLKFNWKFIWVAAGQAKMDMQAITYQGKPCFRSNHNHAISSSRTVDRSSFVLCRTLRPGCHNGKPAAQ